MRSRLEFPVLFMLCLFISYETGCFRVETKQEITQKEGQEDSVTYCHHYCEKKVKSDFLFGSDHKCVCELIGKEQ